VKAELRKAWASRSPRERMIIVALAAVLGAASYLSVLHLAGQSRGQLRASVATLRTQAALVDQQAAEYERLRAAPAAAVSPADLRTLVQSQTDAARMAGAVTRNDALDADHVHVVFGAVSFTDWLGWIAALQGRQVRLEAARVEALSAPGMVSATAMLTRAGAP